MIWLIIARSSVILGLDIQPKKKRQQSEEGQGPSSDKRPSIVLFKVILHPSILNCERFTLHWRLPCTRASPARETEHCAVTSAGTITLLFQFTSKSCVWYFVMTYGMEVTNSFPVYNHGFSGGGAGHCSSLPLQGENRAKFLLGFCFYHNLASDYWPRQMSLQRVLVKCWEV